MIPKIVIVGGGVSGLSAAYYTKKWFEERRLPIELTLVERSERLGGKIRTVRRDGFVIEKGPDSFLARKLPAIELTKELGLEDELTSTNPKAKANYILHKGKLHPMPLGLVLGIPTKVSPFVKTGLISPAGKMRAALDFILPRRPGTEDESLGGFIERRLGKEVLYHITEPLLAGIYAGDTQSLSLNATFPQFRQLEQKYGSLIKGMMAGNKRKTAPDNSGLPDIAKRSLFLTFKRGLVTLIDRLEEELQPIRMMTGQPIERLSKRESGYELTMGDGTRLQADALVLAVPADEAVRLLPDDLSSVRKLENVSYVSVANIALAYREKDIPFPLSGSGFVVPRKEGRTITACTWSSSKWLHVAPPGYVLLRTYVGRAGAQEWTGLSDRELVDGVRRDLEQLMGIRSEPLFHEVSRCYRSMPQYPVGHIEALKAARAELADRLPGVFLCGAGYEGVGIPDCIGQGKQAAERLVEHVGGRAVSDRTDFDS